MHSLFLASAVVLLAVAPGLVVGLLARIPWHLSLAFGVPVTFGMVAIGSYTTGVVSIPWNLATAAVTLAVFMALAVIYRVLLVRYGSARAPDRTDHDHRSVRRYSAPPASLPVWGWLAPPIAGVVVGIGTILYILMGNLGRTPGGFSNVPSGWDSHWHTSVMKFIDETGIASAVEMGQLMNVETHGDLYYPDAWHALNALLIPLTGSTPVQVFNIASIVTVATVVPISVGALAWRIVRDRLDAAPAALAAGVAAGISGMFPALPYVEIGAGAVPFAISAGLAGLVAVLIMSVPGAHMRIPLAALGLVGLAAIHPAGALVAGAMVGSWWLLNTLIWPRRNRLRDLCSLVLVGAVAAIVMVPQIMGVLSETGEIENFNFAKAVPRSEAFVHAVSQQAWALDSHPVRWLLLSLALLGALILLALRSGWWLALWGALVLLATNSMVPFSQPWADLLFTFSSSFYNDARRLGYVQAILMITVAGCALAILLWFAFRTVQKLDLAPRRARAGGLAAAVLVIFGISIWHTPALSEEMRSALMFDRSDRMVSAADREAFAFLAEQPDARTTTIFHDLATGTGWAYPLNGLHMMFNHYYWPAHVGTNQWDVWENVRYLGDPNQQERSAVAEEALRALDVKYLIMSTPVFWHFQEVPPGLRELDQTPGLTEIFDNGEAQIYRVETWRPPTAGEVRVGWGPFEAREGITSDYARPPEPAIKVPDRGTG